MYPATFAPTPASIDARTYDRAPELHPPLPALYVVASAALMAALACATLITGVAALL